VSWILEESERLAPKEDSLAPTSRPKILRPPSPAEGAATGPAPRPRVGIVPVTGIVPVPGQRPMPECCRCREPGTGAREGVAARFPAAFRADRASRRPATRALTPKAFLPGVGLISRPPGRRPAEAPPDQAAPSYRVVGNRRAFVKRAALLGRPLSPTSRPKILRPPPPAEGATTGPAPRPRRRDRAGGGDRAGAAADAGMLPVPGPES
jgi:hypothetical protein